MTLAIHISLPRIRTNTHEMPHFRVKTFLNLISAAYGKSLNLIFFFVILTCSVSPWSSITLEMTSFCQFRGTCLKHPHIASYDN